MMPEIARFYGIIIKLFFGDHPPPHFHVIYGEYNALFDIKTLEMIEGDLPSRANTLVVEWAARYQNELFPRSQVPLGNAILTALRSVHNALE